MNLQGVDKDEVKGILQKKKKKHKELSLLWIGMDTFTGTDQIVSVVLSTDSHKIKRFHVSVPERILVIVGEWKSRWFSMVDMGMVLIAGF